MAIAVSEFSGTTLPLRNRKLLEIPESHMHVKGRTAALMLQVAECTMHWRRILVPDSWALTSPANPCGMH
jgi:hypothetical protein